MTATLAFVGGLTCGFIAAVLAIALGRAAKMEPPPR